MAARASLKQWICVLRELRFFLPILSEGRPVLLKLNTRGPYSSFERKIKFRRSLFRSSIKREIRHFHVVVVHVRSCCCCFFDVPVAVAVAVASLDLWVPIIKMEMRMPQIQNWVKVSEKELQDVLRLSTQVWTSLSLSDLLSLYWSGNASGRGLFTWW